MPQLPNPLPHTPIYHSILLRLGIAVSLIALLAIVSNLTSMVIADNSSGRAKAINLSGSLRMLTHRLSAESLATVPSPQLQETATLFETRLHELRMVAIGPTSKNINDTHNISSIQLALNAVNDHWQTSFKPLVENYQPQHPAAHDIYQAALPMVEKANHLVLLFEQDLEDKILLLRWMMAIALVLGLFLAFLTMLMMKTQVVEPINHLLRVAYSVHQGNWQARSDINSQHEIGTLSTIFNAMVSRLADIHAHLEEKVVAQTSDLAKSNRRLHLLYQSAQTLSHMEMSTIEEAHPDQLWLDWMKQIREALPLRDIHLCLYHHHIHHANPVDGKHNNHKKCALNDCHLCEPETKVDFSSSLSTRRHYKLCEGEKTLGLLLYEPIIEKWTQSDEALMQALSHHLTLSLIRKLQAEDRKRLAIHDERSVLARELHDSLAQELVYLKMQVSLLETSEKNHPTLSEPLQILKNGLHHALTELRELIASFRLAETGINFQHALTAMKNEFFLRAQLNIDIHLNLSETWDSSVESHVLRIIREALINITKHAQAHHAKVTIALMANPDWVQVTIEDDGRGLATPVNTDMPASHHFGMNIMRDRTKMLGGTFSINTSSLGGVAVTINFPIHH